MLAEGAVILALTRIITGMTVDTDFISVGVVKVMGPTVQELLAQ